MDKVGPISFPIINLKLTDEDNRQTKEFAVNNNADRDAKDGQNHSLNQQRVDCATIKEYVSEINIALDMLGYALRVVLEEEQDNTLKINLINTETGQKIRMVTVEEIMDLAQKLHNQKMTLIDKDA